jgi:hypothetical protein
MYPNGEPRQCWGVMALYLSSKILHLQLAGKK